MTKKDYELIARAAKQALTLEQNAGFPDSEYAVKTTINCLASALAGNDPKFNHNKFLTSIVTA